MERKVLKCNNTCVGSTVSKEMGFYLHVHACSDFILPHYHELIPVLFGSHQMHASWRIILFYFTFLEVMAWIYTNITCMTHWPQKGSISTYR